MINTIKILLGLVVLVFYTWVPSEPESQNIIKPDDFEAQYNLGIAYYKQNRYAEAVDAFKKAIKINPNYAEVYNYLGNAYDELNCNAEAVDSYKLAYSGRIRPVILVQNGH